MPEWARLQAGRVYHWPTLLQGKNMKNPEYYRLIKDGRFVGFKRVVTEYLAAGHSKWLLTEEPHDETQRLSKPGDGVLKSCRGKV